MKVRSHLPLGHGKPLLEAVFVDRPNQFTLVLTHEASTITAAMADRGRLTRLLVPGTTVLVEHRDGKHRKTAYQALAAYDVGGHLVSLDTTLPNRLMGQALRDHAIEEVGEYESVRSEQTIGSSRFDFVLTREDGSRLIVEVKSVGRIDDDDVARFPDAPTVRGQRHVESLIDLVTAPNTECAVMFVVQSDRATHVEIDVEIDPDLYALLCDAQDAGVRILARQCALTREGITLGERLPVVLLDG